MPVTLRINGRPVTLDIESRVTLLDALREHALPRGATSLRSSPANR